MSLRAQFILAVSLIVTTFGGAGMGQTPELTGSQPASEVNSASPANLPLKPRDATLVSAASKSATLPPLFDLNDARIKFQTTTLMNTLRDSRHESWVLAAYPDPKTSRPLIGAGFSLDVSATDHPQHDPLNPHTFSEPSSGQLWQAAGLDSERLELILRQYDDDLRAWKKKNFRRKIRSHQLTPEITDEEATSLLRVSTTQAIYNARAYCREFDELTASQQMALSQMVYQMGVNLEEFTQFLGTINDLRYRDPNQPGSSAEKDAQHWKDVQATLVHSQWARRYSIRAISVIAMFNPEYDQNPQRAEHEIQSQVRPHRHHKRAHAKAVRTATGGHHAGTIS